MLFAALAKVVSTNTDSVLLLFADAFKSLTIIGIILSMKKHLMLAFEDLMNQLFEEKASEQQNWSFQLPRL